LGHRGRADAQAAGPHDPDHGRAPQSGAVRAGDLPDRPRRRAGGDPRCRLAARRRPATGGGPRAAAERSVRGALTVSVWSWLKLTVCLWLLRKTVKGAGWLLVFAVVIAAWPLTLVALAGYVL